MSENIKTITKSIQIDASAKNIWKILTDTVHYADWAGVFSPGIFVKTDWNIGSEVIFSDDSKSGLIGHITTNNRLKFLELTYDGEIVDGQPVYDSQGAKDFKGAKESYKITEEYEFAVLEIKSDMTEQLYDEMDQKWAVALQRIKELAEE